MEKLVREPFLVHLSFMALHQTQYSAVHAFTAEGGSCSECVLCIYLCFTCLLEHTGGTHRRNTQEQHTGTGGLHLTLASSCFYIWILITIDPLVDLTCIISVSSSSSMCLFDSQVTSAMRRNYVTVVQWHHGATMVQPQPTLSRSVLQRPVHPEHSSKVCTGYASCTVLPAGKHLTV